MADADLDARIRERLHELATPLRVAFVEVAGVPDLDLEKWQKVFDETDATIRLLPSRAKFEPLPDPRNAAILAILDRHAPVHYDGQVQYVFHDEPVFSADGTARGTVKVRGEVLAPDWCATCGNMAPCDEAREIAKALGIEATDA